MKRHELRTNRYFLQNRNTYRIPLRFLSAQPTCVIHTDVSQDAIVRNLPCDGIRKLTEVAGSNGAGSIKAVATPSAWLYESETFLESLKVLGVSARVRIWGTTWLGS
jgi:hypothetical protein